MWMNRWNPEQWSVKSTLDGGGSSTSRHQRPHIKANTIDIPTPPPPPPNHNKHVYNDFDTPQRRWSETNSEALVSHPNWKHTQVDVIENRYF